MKTLFTFFLLLSFLLPWVQTQETLSGLHLYENLFLICVMCIAEGEFSLLFWVCILIGLMMSFSLIIIYCYLTKKKTMKVTPIYFWTTASILLFLLTLVGYFHRVEDLRLGIVVFAGATMGLYYVEKANK